PVKRVQFSGSIYVRFGLGDKPVWFKTFEDLTKEHESKRNNYVQEVPFVVRGIAPRLTKTNHTRTYATKLTRVFLTGAEGAMLIQTVESPRVTGYASARGQGQAVGEKATGVQEAYLNLHLRYDGFRRPFYVSVVGANRLAPYWADEHAMITSAVVERLADMVLREMLRASGQELPVGEGPPRIAHQPDTPSAKPKDPDKIGGVYVEVVNLYVEMGELQRKLLYMRATLRAGFVAIQEEKQLLANLKETLEFYGANHEKADYYHKWIKEVEDKIAALEKEREELLREAGLGWDKLRKDLDDIMPRDGKDRDLRRDLEGLRAHMEKREQISELEMLLAAGMTAEFRQKLPKALQDPDLAERAAILQVTDLLDRKKMAEALYALRLAQKRHPKNPTIADLMRDIEVGYLRRIGVKAVGDAARIHSLWENFTEGVEGSTFYQALTSGLKRTYQDATGKLAKLEALHASAVDHAAMVHNGVELMRVLRKAGLSFAEIEKLDIESLRAQMEKIAPQRGAPSIDTAENLLIALEVAFQHDDVKRLRADDKNLMHIDVARSYYNQEAFEESWCESAVDLVSAKNVVLIFLPFANTTGPGMLTRAVARFCGSPAARASVLAEQAGALTFQEWVYARPFMQTLATRLAQSRAGQAMVESQHVLRALRYDSPTLVRMGTAAGGFAANVAAHFLLMEGMGHLGKKLGGEYGQLVGELASVVLGVPGTGSVGKLQQGWERSMNALKGARAKWKVTESVLKVLRAPVHEAADTLAAGGRLSASQREALEQAAARADQAAAAARSATAEVGGSALVQSAADEAETLASSAKAALAGQADEAVAASQASKVIGAESQQAAQAAQQAEQRLAGAMPEPTKAPPRPAGASGQRAAGSPAPLESRHVPEGTRTLIPGQPPKAPPAGQPGVEAPPAPRPRVKAPPSVAELEEAAEAAMASGRFEDAAALLGTAARHPQATGPVREQIIDALIEARSAARQAGQVAANSRLPAVQRAIQEADEALVPFARDQFDELAKLKKADMTELKGAGGAYRIDAKDGTPLAVWKPASRMGFLDLEEEGQLISEVLYSRLAQRLGLRVPYAEVMEVEGQLGVLIRWIPDTVNLETLSPGARAAMKEQVAKFRPLQILMGNYDIHFGNLKMDRAGRVWAIDAGNSLLTTPEATVRQSYGLAKMGGFREWNDASNTMNWSRWIRDWYSIEGAKGHGIYGPVHRIESLLRGTDMNRAAERLHAIGETELEKILNEVMKHAKENSKRTKEILDTLLERHKNLSELLNENWPGALPKPSAGVRTPAPKDSNVVTRVRFVPVASRHGLRRAA
ncbi:MAG TPA: hypothetical protein PLD58_19610, partial [Phycisphaerae bacterium]|nr:hypothetical protein [Phycisphaerae bacterium]